MSRQSMESTLTQLPNTSSTPIIIVATKHQRDRARGYNVTENSIYVLTAWTTQQHASTSKTTIFAWEQGHYAIITATHHNIQETPVSLKELEELAQAFQASDAWTTSKAKLFLWVSACRFSVSIASARGALSERLSMLCSKREDLTSSLFYFIII